MNKLKAILTLAMALVVVGCGQDKEPELVSGVHLDALDRATRPQDDFYQFTNGGWLDSTEIPEIYSGYTVYHEVNERVEEALRGIIESAAQSESDPGSEAQKVGDLYNSFMDLEAINAKGIEPIRAELEAIEAIDSIDSLTVAMASLLRAGVPVPYRIQIYPALEDSSQYTVYVNQSGITMPNRDYYLQTDNENTQRHATA